jgi:L-ascorbate metabolism protein UlaG (beta-lactamase superfamily)
MMLDTFVTKGGLPRDQLETVNVGDQVTAGDVKIHVVPAMHSGEPSGRPVGYVLEFADARTLYDEGDTWIFGDMSLIQEFYHPNIILMDAVRWPTDNMRAWPRWRYIVTSNRKWLFQCTTARCPGRRAR